MTLADRFSLPSRIVEKIDIGSGPQSILPHQLRQLGDVGGDAPRFVALS